MTDKNRTVLLGVVVALFVLVNIIAGIYLYKWGSSGTTPPKQVVQVGDTVETGKQPEEVKEQDTEVKAPEPPVTETELQKDSEGAVAEAEVEEKSPAQSGEDSQPQTGTYQSEQQQICKNVLINMKIWLPKIKNYRLNWGMRSGRTTL
ncbi:MAG: hypothetical protein V2I56_20605 [Desulfobacteraceae bacterium]|nr:hypothetical protein [Desulfobacteraceae bacterium]